MVESGVRNVALGSQEFVKGLSGVMGRRNTSGK